MNMYDDSVKIHKTVKIQDMVVPVIGIYKGPSFGQHGKPDYLFEVNGKVTRILGIKNLHEKMSNVSVGDTVKVYFGGSLPSGRGIQYLAIVEVLNG